MSTKILKISFSRLRKSELKVLASRIIVIGEKHNPEALKIKELFDLLVDQQPQIDSLHIGYISHPITKPLKVLRKQRAAYAQGIIDRMKFIENAIVSGMQESLKTAKPIVNQHLQHLWEYDEIMVYHSINSFFKILGENTKLQIAMETLEMTSYLDNLKSLNQTIEELYGKRREDLSRREKGVTLKTKDSIKIALEYLFKEIEVAKIKNRELDYKPLIDEINKEIAIIKANLKARSSYSKKKAEEALNNKVVAENNEVVVENQRDDPSESIHATKRMYPINAEVDNEKVRPEQLDIQKTSAAYKIQTQLPAVPPES